MNIPLSNKDIDKALNGEVNIIAYPNIYKYKNLNELLGKYKKCVLLYMTSSNFGHWTCIYENKGKIYFFDSYGFMPDEQFKFIPRKLNEKLKQDYKHLTNLLIKSNKKVEYNNHQLQSDADEIATCGRWVIERLRNVEIPVNKFAKLFIGRGIEPDKIIYELTSELIGKGLKKLISLEIKENKNINNNKRLTAIFKYDNKIRSVHFGARNAKKTYYDGNASEQDRINYFKRHSKLNEDFSIKGYETPGWLALNVLWMKRGKKETIKHLQDKLKIKNITININKIKNVV